MLDTQTLDADDLVFAYDACGELVLIVATSIGYTSVYSGHLTPCLFSILGALVLLGMATLCPCQFLLILVKELRIAYGFPCRQDHHRFQAQIQSDLLIHYRQWLDLLFY